MGNSESTVKQGLSSRDVSTQTLRDPKLEELVNCVSRRNVQINDLKVKLGKRERERNTLMSDLEEARHRNASNEQMCSEYESRVRALEAKLRCSERKQEDLEIEKRWWERKQQDFEVEKGVRYEEEIRERMRHELRKKRKMD